MAHGCRGRAAAGVLALSSRSRAAGGGRISRRRLAPSSSVKTDSCSGTPVNGSAERAARLQRDRTRDRRADQADRARRGSGTSPRPSSSNAFSIRARLVTRGSAALLVPRWPPSSISSSGARPTPSALLALLGAIYAVQHRKPVPSQIGGAVLSLAHQPLRRLLPRDRGRGVGRFPTHATHAGACAARRCARADCHSDVAVPHCGFGAVRAVGTHLGPESLPHRRDRAVTSLRRPSGGWRASPSSRSGHSSCGTRSQRQRQPARPVHRGPARVRAPTTPTARGGARRHADPAARLAVVPRRRRDRVRAHRSVDTRRLLRAAPHVPRRPGRHDRTRRDSLDLPPLGGGVRGADHTCCSRAVGSVSSTSRTTRSSTRSRSPPAATARGCTPTA